MKKIAICLALGLALTGCAKKPAQTVPKTTDFVRQTLGQAAEQAHSDLAMLAKLRGQGLQPLLPGPEPSLNQPISITWTGPAEGALKEICLQLGYKYRETGRPSAQELSIVINGLNRPAHELLEDIAWQVQPQAVLKLDAVNRVLTLARTEAK